MAESERPQTVFWKNVLRLNRRERFERWFRETFRPQLGTYMLARERDMPFTTSISVAEIDALASEGLRQALQRQQGNVADGDDFLTLPLATEAGEHKGNIHVRRGPTIR